MTARPTSGNPAAAHLGQCTGQLRVHPSATLPIVLHSPLPAVSAPCSTLKIAAACGNTLPTRLAATHTGADPDYLATIQSP